MTNNLGSKVNYNGARAPSCRKIFQRELLGFDIKG